MFVGQSRVTRLLVAMPAKVAVGHEPRDQIWTASLRVFASWPRRLVTLKSSVRNHA